MKFLNSSATFTAVLFPLLLAGCVSKPALVQSHTFSESLDTWILDQESKSFELLQLNISPVEPKTPGGIKPRAGIVVAALHKKDPDYYFHWVRDSANVMRTLVERYAALGGDASKLHQQMKDFLELSQDLQQMHSPYGMGEPRYTVEGLVDKLKWSRPQYDGPALRALAVIRYLKDFEVPREIYKMALEVLRRDMDFIISVWDRRGFDLWEELYAENYHTRLVQMTALDEGAEFFKGHEHTPVPSLLRRELDKHWDVNKNYLRSQLIIEKTDGYTKKHTDLDSAVVVAVVESGRLRGRHSVADPRVQATVAALEKIFREAYPLNKNALLGLAYGRYQGDGYFGGNPWPLITAHYAQFYYRLARNLNTGGDFAAGEINHEFARDLLPQRTWAKDVVWKPGTSEHAELMAACVRKGDRILSRLRMVTPEDGQMYEQFDKATGAPISSRGIGWAHSAFIAASLERRRALAEILPH